MKELPNGVKFAPIGLIKMFNSGGSVKEFSYGSNGTFLLIYKSITFRLVIAI
jgi:raffinose synthase